MGGYEFRRSETGLAPVVGILLLIGITLLLAATVASFAFGFADEQRRSGPQVAFETDFDDAAVSGPDGELTIEVAVGDTVEAGNLYVHRSGTRDSWAALGSYGPTSAVMAGMSVTVTVPSDATVEVVWQGEGTDDSRTLYTWTGPDA